MPTCIKRYAADAKQQEYIGVVSEIEAIDVARTRDVRERQAAETGNFP